MTTTVPTTAAPAVVPARSAALQARRWLLVASPVLAGLFAVLGAAADPAVGIDDERLWRLYAENPGPLQWKSLGLHWSYAFWGLPALLVLQYVRGRGAWLGNLTALIGFAGITTLPGLLFIDWYDSAIGQTYGVEGNRAVNDVMETMWGVPFFVTPGMIGLMFALPLAALTLWRARLVRWWAPTAAVAGFLAFGMSGVTWWGCAITTAFFTVLAVAFYRATARV